MKATEDGKTGRNDGAEESVESRFAQKVAGQGIFGTRNGDLYRFSGSHYERLGDEDAARMAWDWMGENPGMLKQRTEKKALACVGAARLNVPKLRALADAIATERRYVVPTLGKWLEILFDEDGNGKTSNARIVIRDPVADPSRAVFSSVSIRIDGSDGQEYLPKALPSNTRFASFLNSSFPKGGLLGGAASKGDLESAEALMSVQEYVGETLLIGRNLQKTHLWLGEGGNGKGVMMSLISRFHDAKAVDLTALDGFALDGIQDASLAVVDETPKEAFNETRLKSLLGGGQVPIDRKHKSIINVVSKAKWIISSNQEFGIRCKNSGEGFWRRFILVPWSNIIPEEQRVEGLADKIFEREGRAVLDWMLAGLLRCLNGGGALYAASSSRRLKDAAILNSDIVLSFVKEFGGRKAMVSKDSTASRKDGVYEAFRDYCDDSGRIPINAQEFWTRLKKAIPEIEERKARDKADGNKVVRFVNLKIERPEEEGDDAHATFSRNHFSGPASGIAGITLAEEIYGIVSEDECVASESRGVATAARRVKTNERAEAVPRLVEPPRPSRTPAARRAALGGAAEGDLGGPDPAIALLPPLGTLFGEKVGVGTEDWLSLDEMREFVVLSKISQNGGATCISSQG